MQNAWCLSEPRAPPLTAATGTNMSMIAAPPVLSVSSRFAPRCWVSMPAGICVSRYPGVCAESSIALAASLNCSSLLATCSGGDVDQSSTHYATNKAERIGQGSLHVYCLPALVTAAQASQHSCRSDCLRSERTLCASVVPPYLMHPAAVHTDRTRPSLSCPATTNQIRPTRRATDRRRVGT
jgi:hypothetical protein